MGSDLSISLLKEAPEAFSLKTKQSSTKFILLSHHLWASRRGGDRVCRAAALCLYFDVLFYSEHFWAVSGCVFPVNDRAQVMFGVQQLNKNITLNERHSFSALIHNTAYISVQHAEITGGHGLLSLNFKMLNNMQTRKCSFMFLHFKKSILANTLLIMLNPVICFLPSHKNTLFHYFFSFC